MANVQCLIADDEPIAREIIANYCGNLPMLTIVASCDNALEAKAVMQQHHIDILFLDINMPVLDGISFLKTLKQPPQVIFTTAYREYALHAFDLAAVDYLLKPFSLERFIVAVDKAMEKLQRPVAVAEEMQQDCVFVRTDNKIFRLAYTNIIYAEASGNYTKIVTTQHTLLPGTTFTAFTQQLPASIFVRVHRSFIINKSFITHIEGNMVYLNKTGIPISNQYKDAFFKGIGM
jgi:DNA-binding LytR/AlgR family response regulator